MAEISQSSGKTTYEVRAIYNSPENFFDWSWPKVPRQQFLDERNRAFDTNSHTGLIQLDISSVLETTYPATTPAILARYIKIRPGESISHNFVASGEVYYVLEGNGESSIGYFNHYCPYGS